MDDEVEITVIATGFSGASVAEDMKQEVKRNIVTNVHPVEHDEGSQTMDKTEQQKEHEMEDEQQIPSSRIEIDDSDIPSFIKKLKNRF